MDVLGAFIIIIVIIAILGSGSDPTPPTYD
jgi:hypothetical protein